MTIKKIVNAAVLIFICVTGTSSYGEKFTLSGNSLSVTLSGYMLSCAKLELFIYENDRWRPARRDLPVKGNYYIDDRFVRYGWCDNLVCNPIEQPVKIDLVEYERAGERPRQGDNVSNKKFPVFKSIYLKGKIKIEITYFKDKNCTVGTVYSKTFLIE